MPEVTVVAAIRVQLDAFEGPGELGRGARLAFGAVPLLRRAGFLKVRGEPPGGPCRGPESTAFHAVDGNGLATLEIVTDLTLAEPTVSTNDELDESGDERRTHLVLEGFTRHDGRFIAAGNSVVDAMVNDSTVRALCGKRWVPGRDPRRYPVCRDCARVAAARGWSVPTD